MERFFTSDIHFGDSRFHLFHRDLLPGVEKDDVNSMETYIIKQWNRFVSKDDIVYILGDISIDVDSIHKLSFLNGKKMVVLGNYDEGKEEEISKYAEILGKSYIFHLETDHPKCGKADEDVFLNHYPTRTRQDMFNIVGHIHGLWRVQENMLNVGLDAWNMVPLHETRLWNVMWAMRHLYDKNVFVK